MNLKKITASVIAAILMSVGSIGVSADETNLQTTYQTEAVQTTPAPVTTPQATVPQTTPAPATTKPKVTMPDTPTYEAATIALRVSSVKDGKFTAKLNIKSQAPIVGLSVWAEYNSKQIKYTGCKQSAKIGGTLTSKADKSKVLLNYANNSGSDFDGTYVTLNFKMVDNTVSSTVIYLNVESLTTVNGTDLGHSDSNGVVNNNEYRPAIGDVAANKFKPLKLYITKSPVTLESLGIKNVKDCMVERSDILKYKNGSLELLNLGSSRMEVTFKDGKTGYYEVFVEQEPVTTTITKATTAATTPQITDDSENKNGWIWLVGGLIVAALLAVILLLYFIIIRPERKRKALNKAFDDDEYDDDDYDDDDYDDDDYDDE